jgi:hypothetical protein
MVADPKGRRVWMIFFMLTPVRACASWETASAANTMVRVVGLDAVADSVEYRPCGQVGLDHPEGPLDLVEVVVGRADTWAVHHVDTGVGDISLQPGQLAGAFDPVDALVASVIFFSGRVPAARDQFQAISSRALERVKADGYVVGNSRSDDGPIDGAL